jgi:hypothetical protein
MTNEQQSRFSLPNPYQKYLDELKAVGFSNATFIRDAVDFQLQEERIVDAALKEHSFLTYFLEVL